MKRWAWTAAAALVCLGHFASFDFRRQALVTDVRYYVYFAWRVAEGDVPHRDFFDNKTQLASFAGTLFHELGRGLGGDGLRAIRLGYLGLTAAGGMLAFVVWRRLGAGHGMAGFLGLLAYCSFGLLGTLASIGNTPKLLMALGAPAAALLACRGHWFGAGVVGALAFMDWQIGALVWLSALVSACVFGARRLAAALAVAAGGFVGLAPFLAYFAAHGALRESLTQTIAVSFARGSAAAEHADLAQRLASIHRLLGSGCRGQVGLVYLGLAGCGVLAWWLWRWRGQERQRLLVPLAVYHFGLVGFSLTDFQGYGDLYALLHSVAFFLAAVWVALYEALGGRALASFLLCLAVGALARPGPLRPAIELDPARVRGAQATLADQQEVAAALRPYVEGRRLAFLENCELLFLSRQSPVLPLAYFNLPAWIYFRSSPAEPPGATSARLLRAAAADVVVYPRFGAPDPQRERVVRLEATTGAYAVTLVLRD